MGRSPCCDKVGLKKGPWTPEEDQKLLAYIEEHGHGSWRALPSKAGLQRCGKSCRLRWTNYLRPDIKRGKFSVQEEQTIIQLHALLGNRWSAIATHLPKRTDNEIKNYWNTHLKKRLAKMGIDPVTHKPKSDALLLSNDSHNSNTNNKHAANLSHMAQWESARLEAEARLVRQSKLRSNSFHPEFSSSPSSPPPPPPLPPSPPPPRCLDILKAWNGVWSSSTATQANNNNEAASAAAAAAAATAGLGVDLESPTSTLSYSENAPQQSSSGINNGSNNAFTECVGNNNNNNNNSSGSCEGIMKEEEGEEDWKDFGSSNNLVLHEFNHHHHDNNNKGGINNIIIENSISSFTSAAGIQDHDHDLSTVVPMDTSDDDDNNNNNNNVHPFVERFTDLLLSNSTTADRGFSEGCGDSSDNNNGGVNVSGSTSEYFEDNKNYWNSILNLVNSSSPSDSAMF